MQVFLLLLWYKGSDDDDDGDDMMMMMMMIIVTITLTMDLAIFNIIKVPTTNSVALRYKRQQQGQRQ